MGPVEVVLRFEVGPRAEPSPLVRFHVNYESPTDGPQRLEQELTLEEIGAITGVGRETVKSRLRYAMDKLRAGLTNE